MLRRLRRNRTDESQRVAELRRTLDAERAMRAKAEELEQRVANVLVPLRLDSAIRDEELKVMLHRYLARELREDH